MVKHDHNIICISVLTCLIALFCSTIWADTPILKIIGPPMYVKRNGGCHPLCKACYYNEKTVEVLTRIETQKAEKLQEFESDLESLPQIYYERCSLFLAVKALKLIEEKEGYLLNVQKKSDYIRQSYKRNMSRLGPSDYLMPISVRELDSNPTMREWYKKKGGILPINFRPIDTNPDHIRRKMLEERLKRLKDDKTMPRDIKESLERTIKESLERTIKESGKQ